MANKNYHSDFESDIMDLYIANTSTDIKDGFGLTPS